MLRRLYIQLIWFHPAPFRRRFGDDMLDDFDRARYRDKPRYFADAVASLARQWLLRPEFRRRETAKASIQAAGAPLFQTIEDYRPHSAALLHGGLLAILSILTAVFLIGKGGGMAKPFTTVNRGPDPLAAWLRLALPYFGSMPVLRALDADRDFTLSPWEIGNAPAALRKLDVNHDGKVTAEECGLYIDADSVPPAMAEKLRRQFMSYHPVLAALDANHDGEISGGEIDRAAAALRTLDRNHDGYLTADELIPPEMAFRAGPRFGR